MINIKVERRISKAKAVLAIAFCVLCVALLVKLVGTEGFACIPLLIIAIEIYLRKGFDKTKYVSDLAITNDSLSLIYSVRLKNIGEEKILLDEIESVKAVLIVNAQYVKNSKMFSGHTALKIVLKDKKEISFETSQTDTGIYSFLFDMIKHRDHIPGFSYEVKTAEKNVLDDVDYFVKNGRQLPFYKMRPVRKGDIIISIIFLALFAAFMIWFL